MGGLYTVICAVMLMTLRMEITRAQHTERGVKNELPTCPPNENGQIILYPKPENCSEFYQCGNGYLYTHACGKGLYYCAEKQYCDYIDNCDYSNCKLYPSSLIGLKHKIQSNYKDKIKAELPSCPPPSGNSNATILPNAEDCSKYYMCDNAGHLLQMECPVGLLYCSEKQVCAWEWDNECKFQDCKIVPSKVMKPKKAEFIAKIPSNYEVEIQDVLPTCPPPSGTSNATLFPNSEDCSKYYMCDNAEHLLPKDCPAGLLYCSEKQVCAWDWDSDCKFTDCKIVSSKSVKPTKPGNSIAINRKNSHKHERELPTCPPNENGQIILYPKPENCSEFYQCGNGYLYTHACGKGLYYCAEKQYCDYIDNCDYSNCKLYPSSLIGLKRKIQSDYKAEIKAELPSCPPPSGNNSNATIVPNAEDCSKYYMCDNAGQLLLMDCPVGLLYCSEKQVCAWECDNECKFQDCKIVPSKAMKPKIAEFIAKIPSNYEVEIQDELPTCPPPSGTSNATLFPNSENCSKYYMCDNAGHLLPKDCPVGLLYCSEKQVCAWDWDSDCKFADCKIVSSVGNEPRMFFKSVKGHNNVQERNENDLPVCPPNETGEIILYPKPENCSEFYQCGFGHLYTHACGKGLYYCAAKEYCDYIDNCDYSGCQLYPSSLTKLKPLMSSGYKSEAKEELPICPPPSGSSNATLFPNSEDCSKYYMCDNAGHLILKDCPTGLLYCSEKQVCAWNWDNECKFSDCKISSLKQ